MITQLCTPKCKDRQKHQNHARKQKKTVGNNKGSHYHNFKVRFEIAFLFQTHIYNYYIPQTCISFFFFFFNLFIYLWLCWVFVSVRGLSPVAASRGHSSSQCAGLSLSWPLPLRSSGSVVVAHGPSCSAACGIFPDQGSNPCLRHWQADS